MIRTGSRPAIEALTNVSHKLAEMMYAQAAQENPDGRATGASGKESKKDDDDVVDADFEEVK